MQGRILGIDHGDARIGVAISDELGMLAHPRETIEIKKVKNPAAHIAALQKQENATRIILGLPRNMDGSEGASAEKVRAFAKKLEALVTCPVQLLDERMSTQAAQRSLHAAGRNAKNSRSVIDQVAAQHILQGYLDSRPPLIFPDNEG